MGKTGERMGLSSEKRRILRGPHTAFPKSGFGPQLECDAGRREDGVDPSVSSGRCIMVGIEAAIKEVFGVGKKVERAEVDPVGEA